MLVSAPILDAYLPRIVTLYLNINDSVASIINKVVLIHCAQLSSTPDDPPSKPLNSGVRDTEEVTMNQVILPLNPLIMVCETQMKLAQTR